MQEAKKDIKPFEITNSQQVYCRHKIIRIKKRKIKDEPTNQANKDENKKQLAMKERSRK